jgi:hypothetical protein
VNRRDFLQGIGVGSLAAGTLPLIGQPALAHFSSDSGNQRHFRLVAFSFAGEEAIGIEGSGIFTNTELLQANGSFVHVSWPPPSTILGQGTWKRKRGGDFSYERGFGSIDVLEASIVTLEIRMVPSEGTGGDPFTATLEVTCNFGPTGLSTGQDEGFVLTLPDGTTFVPAVPAVGLTFITTKH